MTQSLTIALDAMGGDKAPDLVIEGAARFARKDRQIQFLIFGDEQVVRPLMDRFPGLADRWQLEHTEVKIDSGARARDAFRVRNRRSSMRLALEAVADGRAHASVSAGNTGALMGLSKHVLGMVPGIDRPAIVSALPTLNRGSSVLLDLGANVTCTAENLSQFAVMGAAYASTSLDIPSPSVGLLNVGSEDLKGNDVVQEAHRIMKDLPLGSGEYIGFVEGDDIQKGACDVIVTDGFTGNVALKTTEGLARLIQEYIRRAFRGSIFGMLAYAIGFNRLRMLRAQLDPRRYNGAVLVGLNAISVKSHGGTDALGFANAIGVAANLYRHHFLDTISQRLEVANAQIIKTQELASEVLEGTGDDGTDADTR